MKIEQIPENGDGFQFPVPDVLDSIIYDFEVAVEPCQFSEYTATIAPAQITYVIGDENAVTNILYQFQDDSQCNYPEQIIVSDLPDFIEHSLESHEFSIQPFNELERAGMYPVLIEAVISYPTSATDFTIKETSATHEIEFVIVDPCTQTEFLEWTIEPIQIDEETQPFTFTLPVLLDQASFDYGPTKDGTTYCGPRIYDIISDSSVYDHFMTIDGSDSEGRTFMIEPSEDTVTGVYQIIVQAALQNYPDLEPKLMTVQVIYDATCEV